MGTTVVTGKRPAQTVTSDDGWHTKLLGSGRLTARPISQSDVEPASLESANRPINLQLPPVSLSLMPRWLPQTTAGAYVPFLGTKMAFYQSSSQA